jgi:predicted ferric reductase
MTENDYKRWIERYGGWILIWIFCLIPIVVFTYIRPISTSYGSWYDVFANLGRILGIIGFVLYAINMLLALRKRWLENFFGGLNRVYIAHHITGGIALAFLVFHPLFLAIRYIEAGSMVSFQDAAKQLLPRGADFNGVFPLVQANLSFDAGIIAFWGMVVLLIITFFVRLPYRLWLFTHKFLGVAFLFAGIHVLFISSDVKNNAFLFTYMAIWIVVGLTAFIYRSLLGNVLVRRSPYRVDRVVVVAGNTIAVELTPIEKAIDFVPGQFVFARFLWSGEDGVSKETHPFSIASAPNEKTLRLYMKALGDYTNSLSKLKVGTIAEVEGAFGKFSYTHYGDRPQVWIAGGIGVTPFLSMARSIGPGSPQIDMFYSVVKKEELVDQKALDEFLPSRYPKFKYYTYIADERPGYLTGEYVQKEVGDLRGKEIFVCGPPAMMKSMRAQLRKLGVPNRRIHTEEFSMS